MVYRMHAKARNVFKRSQNRRKRRLCRNQIVIALKQMIQVPKTREMEVVLREGPRSTRA